MARQLWLLRHAEAEPHGSREDPARRLTERGEQQARAAGAAIARMGARFDAVLYSPKVRAAQTAEMAAEGWEASDRERLEVYPPLAGGFDAAQALEAIAGRGPEAKMLLVGHEPDLSIVAGELTGGRVDLKKGGLAVLRLDGPSAELAVLMRPRELGLIAGVPVGGH
ncbi:MAG TPA: phosphohistidine phosphatase SixA [Solirubrobacteraceae bacterium]